MTNTVTETNPVFTATDLHIKLDWLYSCLSINPSKNGINRSQCVEYGAVSSAETKEWRCANSFLESVSQSKAFWGQSELILSTLILKLTLMWSITVLQASGSQPFQAVTSFWPYKFQGTPVTFLFPKIIYFLCFLYCFVNTEYLE